jgi:hyperosmotically inducible protein
MSIKISLLAAMTAVTLLSATGCAVQRDQETVGSYVDDSAITLAVKSRFVESKEVDASSISVETLNGTVMLSGFSKSAAEKEAAGQIAWKVKGVKSVKNEIAIRP